jgi:hypothetical protein
MNVYQKNLADGVDIADIKKMVQAETWLNGAEAAKYFNIEVGEENKAAASISDYYAKYLKTPAALVKARAEPPKLDTEKEKLLLELDLLS